MSTINIEGEQGGSLQVVHSNGTVDVYSVPANSNIWVEGQKGFGDLAKTNDSVSLSTATAEVATLLGNDGAQ